jgi:hypothetical protein
MDPKAARAKLADLGDKGSSKVEAEADHEFERV